MGVPFDPVSLNASPAYPAGWGAFVDSSPGGWSTSWPLSKVRLCAPSDKKTLIARSDVTSHEAPMPRSAR